MSLTWLAALYCLLALLVLGAVVVWIRRMIDRPDPEKILEEFGLDIRKGKKNGK
jgi:drug/metabolite transporter (DMT)-like permease